MEYLLVMSLSGSVMTGICLALRRLLRDKASMKLYYLLEKAAVLYYLLPLSFLKDWYRKALQHIIPEKPMGIVQVSLTWTKDVIHVGEKTYFNPYAIIQAVSAVVWLAAVCFLLAGMLADYVRTGRVIAGCADKKMTEQQKVFLAGIKEQYRVKRHVVLSRGYAGADTMTFGVRRPVIICDREAGSREAELLVRHEMVHIKRRDAIWKMLMQLAVILHWWNPVVRILRRDLEFVCECSCDETVIQGKTEKEIREYRDLMLREAAARKETEKAPLRWQTCFGGKQSKIKERMDNLMKKKRWNRFAAMAVLTVLVLANSMTVFAYRDAVDEDAPEGTSETVIDEHLHCDTLVFTPNGTSEEERQEYTLLEREEIQYGRQFTDEEGNIYPIAEEDAGAIYRGCSHTYVSGTVAKHHKNLHGNCEVTEYSAQRCSKCGHVVRGEEINMIIHKVCPH